MSHGLYSTYQHGCRCGPCTRAVADYGKDWRARAVEYQWRKLPPAPLAAILENEAKMRSRQGQQASGNVVLAREYSLRYGGRVMSHVKFLERLAQNHYVWEQSADRWLTLIGSHLDTLYPRGS